MISLQNPWWPEPRVTLSLEFLKGCVAQFLKGWPARPASGRPRARVIISLESPAWLGRVILSFGESARGAGRVIILYLDIWAGIGRVILFLEFYKMNYDAAKY